MLPSHVVARVLGKLPGQLLGPSLFSLFLFDRLRRSLFQNRKLRPNHDQASAIPIRLVILALVTVIRTVIHARLEN